MTIRMDDNFLYDIEVNSGKGKTVFPSRNSKGNFLVNLDGRSKGKDRFHEVSFDELVQLFADGNFRGIGSIRMKAKGEKGPPSGWSPTQPRPPALARIYPNLLALIEKRRKSAQISNTEKSKRQSSDAATPLMASEMFGDGQSEQTFNGSGGPNSISSESNMASENEPSTSTGTNGIRRPMTLEDLQSQLDRRSEIGEAGELIALEYERARLRSKDIGCPDPDRYVKHVALTDVGRGYDIESFWPGNERCIEVKSSTNSGNDIFMSDNEKRVLTELGNKAWLYRVVVDADGDGEVVLRLNDPMNKIPDTNISAAVWRIQLPKSDV